jgi:DNA-binding MarR family transcriptional regulator
MPEAASMEEPHVGHLIRRAQQIHTRRWGAEVSDEVTSPQIFILVALARTPDSDQRTLGEAVSLDRSTTADVVERMIRRGFIERSRDPSDHRRYLLRITPAGRELLAEIHQRTIAMNARLLGLLEPADRSEFIRLLRTFVAAADREDLGAGDGTTRSNGSMTTRRNQRETKARTIAVSEA